MKKTHRLFIFTALLMYCFSFGQPPRGEGQQGEGQGPPPIPNAKQITEMVTKLDTDIKLTDNQEAAILRLYTEHFEAVKSKISGSTRPKREDMEALRNNVEKKVNSILTPEQKKAYKKFLTSMMNQPPPPPSR